MKHDKYSMITTLCLAYKKKPIMSHAVICMCLIISESQFHVDMLDSFYIVAIRK